MPRLEPHRDEDESGPDEPASETVYIFTRQAVREVDRLAVEQYGIPSMILMENAGLHLAEVTLDLADADPARLLIVCGPGNNGGDGLCGARHLHNAGAHVEILLSGKAEACRGDAAVQLNIARKMGLAIIEAKDGSAVGAVARTLAPDLVIDALLGTGLERAVQEPIAGLIRGINVLGESGATIVSADLPSGLDCDTGEPLGIAVRAGTTVSFVGLKAGFVKLGAQAYIGDVVVADIGAPRELTERLGQRLQDHELHDSPEDRPGHSPAPGEPQRRG